MEYRRVPIAGEAVVVSFDLCSSSDIYEQLLLRGKQGLLVQLLTKVKELLAKQQEGLSDAECFDLYKFTGDGWILLYPAKFSRSLLYEFLVQLCDEVHWQLEHVVFPALDAPPAINGVTFGIDKGPLTPVTIFGVEEYIGRAINVACRLQKKVEHGEPPTYKALMSKIVHREYFALPGVEVGTKEEEHLKNILGDRAFECWEVDLTPPLLGFSESPPTAKQH